MEVKTYRARSLQEALQQVRRDLGPDAAVLQTREVKGWLGWLTGACDVEVTAATEVHVPSRLALAAMATVPSDVGTREPLESYEPAESPPDFGYRSSGALSPRDTGRSLVEELCQASRPAPASEFSAAVFQVFTDLIEAEFSEELARELIERVRMGLSSHDQDDPLLLKSRLLRVLDESIPVSGPIAVTPGQRRVVALVGPTGVGKTTTIAKLAANLRLRDEYRVGLITVDTYRIAAVEQLRTYADIMDLPMEVVSTPREMRQALQRLADMDVVLLDTAGRSPRDEVRIQELKSILAEAHADEVHLVLSCAASLPQLKKTAEKFARVGVTSLLCTKLDEATGLGNLLPLVQSSRLPLSYLTNGQNVPEDIQPAESRKLARWMLSGPEGEW